MQNIYVLDFSNQCLMIKLSVLFNLALEEIPEKLCDNKSDSIICYHSRKPGFSESDNGEPLTLCGLS